MIKQEKLKDYLQELNFSKTEAEIYIYLIFNGPKTILEIAKELIIPRTSLYDTTTILLEKGFIERIIFYKTQKFQVSSLDILEYQINKKRKEIENFNKLIPDLKAAASKISNYDPKTKVRYYHGKQGLRQMMWNSLQAKGKTWGYTEFGRENVVGKRFRKQYLEETVKRNIKDRVITNIENYKKAFIFQFPRMNINNEIEQIRVVDKNRLYITGDIMIYNNNYALSYWKNVEIIGVEIENEEFVKNQTSLFEVIWEIAQPLNTK